jgi:hypothetical protein
MLGQGLGGDEAEGGGERSLEGEGEEDLVADRGAEMRCRWGSGGGARLYRRVGWRGTGRGVLVWKGIEGEAVVAGEEEADIEEIGGDLGDSGDWKMCMSYPLQASDRIAARHLWVCKRRASCLSKASLFAICTFPRAIVIVRYICV